MVDDEIAEEGAPDPPGHAVTVYRYGLVGDLPEAAIAELRRAHTLRNKLVEIERAFAERKADVWVTHPAVAAAEEARETAKAALAAIEAEAAEERKTTRSPRNSKEMAARIKEAKGAVSRAKAAHREAQEAAYPTVKPAMIEAREERKAAIKATYAEWRDHGLYWATYNDVRDQHQVATRRIEALRRAWTPGASPGAGVPGRRGAGRPPELHFHGFRGEGTLTVQLQRQAGDPVPDAAMLANPAGKWASVLQVAPAIAPAEWATWDRPERRRRGRGTVRFRIGAGEAKGYVEMPVVIHRPLPEGAEVKLARITRKVIAGKPRCTISLTCRIPPPAARTHGGLVAVHLGWRRRPDGRIRVATIHCATRPPDHLGDLVRPLGAHRWEVATPAAWEQTALRLARIAGHRDTNHNNAKEELIAWLSTQAGPVEVGEHQLRVSDIAKWRLPRHLATVALAWRANPPEGGAAIATTLEAWRKQDRHLWEWHAHMADQLAGWRSDAWARVAAWLAADAGILATDTWAVSDAARPTTESPNTYQAKAAQRLRTLSSPAGLRAAIERACAREGVEVVPGAAGPALHVVCGTALEGDAAASVMLHCPHCDTMVDQDVETLGQMVASATSAEVA